MMLRLTSVCLAVLAGLPLSQDAQARSRQHHEPITSIRITTGSPTLAPFQHVRFCLRYPTDCVSTPTENSEVELDADTSDLLKRINRSVNLSIIPIAKSYGSNLADGWTVAPDTGDCNDYAVTKRHELIKSGLPASALRLSVVKTASGIGHLVLVVATSKGDIVLDNLAETIRPWQATDYQWLKIQSASNAKMWNEVKAPATISISQAEPKIRLADR